MTDIRKLDLNLVIVLDALLAEPNLTRAGERVGMTQPAVSGALARLREVFGDPLLERSGRGFVLTPRAEALIPAVEECMAAVEHTFDVVPTFNPATSTRTFFISASDYALAEITSPLLSVLKQHAPHTSVSFDGLPIEGTVSPTDLLRRDITIAATGRGVPGKRSSLFSDRFVCIADAANPALEGGALSMEALRRLSYVRSAFGPNSSTPVDDMLGAAELTPRAALTVQGFMQVPFEVSGTGWIGWVPERTARRYAPGLGLVVAETPVAPHVLVEAAHWHPSKSNDPALQWLVRQLRRAAELVEFGDDPEALDAGLADDDA